MQYPENSWICIPSRPLRPLRSKESGCSFGARTPRLTCNAPTSPGRAMPRSGADQIHAAIHIQRLPRDPRRQITRQVHRGFADVAAFYAAAEGGAFVGAFAHAVGASDGGGGEGAKVAAAD